MLTCPPPTRSPTPFPWRRVETSAHTHDRQSKNILTDTGRRGLITVWYSLMGSDIRCIISQIFPLRMLSHIGGYDRRHLVPFVSRLSILASWWVVGEVGYIRAEERRKD